MAARSSRSKTQAAAQAAGLPAGTDSDLVTAWNNRLENDCDLYDTLRTSCCFALGKLRINQVPRKGGRCKRLICGKACGNIKPWAFASPDECEDYCVACQAIQMVTPEDETADIAAMTKRGPLYNQELKPTILREYTTPISTVEKRVRVVRAQRPLLQVATGGPEARLPGLQRAAHAGRAPLRCFTISYCCSTCAPLTRPAETQ